MKKLLLLITLSITSLCLAVEWTEEQKLSYQKDFREELTIAINILKTNKKSKVQKVGNKLKKTQNEYVKKPFLDFKYKIRDIIHSNWSKIWEIDEIKPFLDLLHKVYPDEKMEKSFWEKIRDTFGIPEPRG